MYTQIALLVLGVWLVVEICKNDRLKKNLRVCEFMLDNSEKQLKEAREAAISFYCQKKG